MPVPPAKSVNVHEKIQVSAAIPIPAAEGNEGDIGLFVQAVEGEVLEIDAIRGHCIDVMPRYMVPAHIRIVEEMPLTPTGNMARLEIMIGKDVERLIYPGVKRMFLRLRQLCLVAAELAPVVTNFESVLGLKVCHRDPGVAQFGLHNALLPIGHTFIEIVAPTEAGTTAERYLKRRGGDGGYMVIHDTDDLDDWEKHVAAIGVRVAASLALDDYWGLQLHPRDTGGALLEINTTRGGADLEGAYGPAGSNWQPSVRTERVQAVLGAELQADDPQRLAQRWGEILRRPVEPDDDGFRVRLDEGYLRFVHDKDGRGEGLGGIDLRVGDPAAVLEAAGARNLPTFDGGVMIGGVRFYLLAS